MYFGRLQASVTYGFPQHDGAPPPGNMPFTRGILAHLGPDEFRATGLDSRVRFHLPAACPAMPCQILSARGRLRDAAGKPVAAMNGGNLERGLQFHVRRAVVRILLASSKEGRKEGASPHSGLSGVLRSLPAECTLLSTSVEVAPWNRAVIAHQNVGHQCFGTHQAAVS